MLYLIFGRAAPLSSARGWNFLIPLQFLNATRTLVLRRGLPGAQNLLRIFAMIAMLFA